ncbi:P-loop containing nucleoside triphosphate hydrolase protein [Cladorrhinum sp. PSN332]|nr:P-loop containing nucleoside triphosphate hydrolase protein [Cladorrhinum sp. PSN332]
MRPSPTPTQSTAYARRRDLRARKPRARAEHLGQKSNIQTFFEAPNFKKETPQWVEFAPPSVPEVQKIKFEGAAIQLYKCRNPAGEKNEGGFFIQSIRLQSPYLREALEKDLIKNGIPYNDLPYAESSSPHWGLFFIRDRLAEVIETTTNELTRDHCELLYSVVEEIFEDVLDELEASEMQGGDKISFKLLWTLFPPGHVFAMRSARQPPLAYKVKGLPWMDHDYGQLKLRATYVMFDGYQFGTRETEFYHSDFPDLMPISAIHNIEHVNLSHNLELRARLLERGKKMLDLQTIRFMNFTPDKSARGKTFNGRSVDEEPQRVIIDPFLFRRRKKGHSITPLPGYVAVNAKKELSEVKTASQLTETKGTQDADREAAAKEEKGSAGTQEAKSEVSRRITEVEVERNRKVAMQDEDNLLTMRPYAYGYSLDTACWDSFDVDALHPVEKDERILDKVVMDEQRKDVIKTLVESHIEDTGRTPYYDLIDGKGQCLVVILSGPPGTGKTLLVESLAAHLGCPLLRADSAYLSSTNSIEGYEASLNYLLKDATQWGALVLFDEPAFLFQNQESDSDKGELLAFLRNAEYFRGVIFLTTNITRPLDRAVLSRAQVHLTFSSLVSSQRVKVWENFAKWLPEEVGCLSADDISRLAAWKINGREIKNILNMSISWCRKKDRKVNVEDIESLLSLICPTAEKEQKARQSSVSETIAEVSLLDLS